MRCSLVCVCIILALAPEPCKQRTRMLMFAELVRQVGGKMVLQKWRPEDVKTKTTVLTKVMLVPLAVFDCSD